MPKAAVCVDFTKPLEIRDVAVRDPGPGEVRVRLEASGICHTDLHSTRGDWPIKSPLPFIAGHEGVGIVEAVGEGTIRKVGERVCIPWLGYACGHCRYCVGGWETLCPNQSQNGCSVTGRSPSTPSWTATGACRSPRVSRHWTPRRWSAPG